MANGPHLHKLVPPVCPRCNLNKHVAKHHWDSGATCGYEEPIWTCMKYEIPVR